ncbi:hypothetical protein TNCV_2707071 [Trichonephila clavipes]|nr:hypothetical protein TNCV_2707071 [Trichonephila clavipes]
MKVTWCEFKTVWRMVQALPTYSCNMVLRCHRRVWSCIVIQQQSAGFEKSKPLVPNHLFQFQQAVAVTRSIDGSNLQKVHAKVNTSSICKSLSFFWRAF